MICEFALKKDGKICCMCANLGRGLINGKPTNVSSNSCEENKNCYYKLWKKSILEKKEGKQAKDEKQI